MALQARVRHVVLDEADLLLTPAYGKAVSHLLQVWGLRVFYPWFIGVLG